MGNIIIKNKSHRIDDVLALWYVQQVIEEGRVSDTGTAYCYLTVFNTNIVVNAKRNKKSDTFLVYDYQREKDD